MKEIIQCIENILNLPDSNPTAIHYVHLSDEMMILLDDHLLNRNFIGGIFLNIAEDALNPLVEVLRNHLNDFIDPKSDRIGIATELLNIANPSLKEFAEILVNASTIMTPRVVAKYLEHWKNGFPIQYREKIHIVGLSTDKSIKIFDGLQLDSTQTVSKILEFKYLQSVRNAPLFWGKNYTYVPMHISPDFNHINNLGSVLALSWVESPSLYKPDPINLKHISKCRTVKLEGTEIQNDYDKTRQQICDSLSLCCNYYVKPMVSWIDLGELLPFKLNSSHFIRTPYFETKYTKKVTELDFLNFKEIYNNINRNILKVPGLEIALSRWIKSLRVEDFYTEKCIDLRIALEALYLGPDNSDRGKKKMVSERAAKHLGESHEDNNEICELISNFYGDASDIIHVSNIQNLEVNDSKNLVKVQNLVRAGLLKKLANP